MRIEDSVLNLNDSSNLAFVSHKKSKHMIDKQKNKKTKVDDMSLYGFKMPKYDSWMNQVYLFAFKALFT